MPRRSTNVDAACEINNILQWLEDGHHEISDDEDDLDDLEDIHVHEEFIHEVEREAASSQIQDIQVHQPCTSSHYLEDEEVIPPRKNYPTRRAQQEQPFTDTSPSSEDEEEILIVPARGRRRILTSNRRVHSIDSALDPEKYNDIGPPCNTKGDHSVEVLTCLGSKKSKHRKTLLDIRTKCWTSERL